jgi:hypothetical protein
MGRRRAVNWSLQVRVFEVWPLSAFRTHCTDEYIRGPFISCLTWQGLWCRLNVINLFCDSYWNVLFYGIVTPCCPVAVYRRFGGMYWLKTLRSWMSVNSYQIAQRNSWQYHSPYYTFRNLKHVCWSQCTHQLPVRRPQIGRITKCDGWALSNRMLT